MQLTQAACAAHRAIEFPLIAFGFWGIHSGGIGLQWPCGIPSTGGHGSLQHGGVDERFGALQSSIGGWQAEYKPNSRHTRVDKAVAMLKHGSSAGSSNVNGSRKRRVCAALLARFLEVGPTRVISWRRISYPTLLVSAPPPSPLLQT